MEEVLFKKRPGKATPPDPILNLKNRLMSAYWRDPWTSIKQTKSHDWNSLVSGTTLITNEQLFGCGWLYTDACVYLYKHTRMYACFHSPFPAYLFFSWYFLFSPPSSKKKKRCTGEVLVCPHQKRGKISVVRQTLFFPLFIMNTWLFLVFLMHTYYNGFSILAKRYKGYC